MSPQESIKEQQDAYALRLVVIEQQMAVLRNQKFVIEQASHALVNAMICYDTREYLAGIPKQRQPDA